ncbi:MAG: pre-peptidase C-terminal domain-containing protein [Gemmataceae bacterium]
MGLPILNSNPGAAATLYLDFLGDFEPTWYWQYGDLFFYYRNVSTPAFDLDGNAESFNAKEQAAILNVWQRVAEDFAPFNINVTTAYYGPFDNGVALKAVIGGFGEWMQAPVVGSWTGSPASGISSIGSFHDDAPNVVFACASMITADFAVNFGPELANTVSHEAGHAFGLRHQSDFVTVNGKLTLQNQYSQGTDVWKPIMGNTLSNNRSTWANGPVDTDGNQLFTEDELAIITAANNGFGYRRDDYGNTIATATPLTVSNGIVSAQGIIGRMSDVDVFSFDTAGGKIALRVDVAAVGPNLDTKIELRDASGVTIARADPTDDLGATIQTTFLRAGKYYLCVMSHGAYGDLGQYTISGSVTTALSAVPPPGGQLSLNNSAPLLGPTNILAGQTSQSIGAIVPPSSQPVPGAGPLPSTKSPTSGKTSVLAIDQLFATGYRAF